MVKSWKIRNEGWAHISSLKGPVPAFRQKPETKPRLMHISTLPFTIVNIVKDCKFISLRRISTLQNKFVSHVIQAYSLFASYNKGKYNKFRSSFISFFVCLLNSTKDRRGGSRQATGFQWKQKRHQINMKTWDQKAETHTTAFFSFKNEKFLSFEGILTICCRMGPSWGW